METDQKVPPAIKPQSEDSSGNIKSLLKGRNCLLVLLFILVLCVGVFLGRGCGHDAMLTNQVLGQWIEEGSELSGFGAGSQNRVLTFNSDGTWRWEITTTGAASVVQDLFGVASDSGTWRISNGRLLLTVEKRGLPVHDDWTPGNTYQLDVHAANGGQLEISSWKFRRR